MRVYYEYTFAERFRFAEEARARIATAADACDGAALRLCSADPERVASDKAGFGLSLHGKSTARSVEARR